MASWTILINKIRNIAYMPDNKWELAGEEQKKGILQNMMDYAKEYLESDENTD